MMKLSLASALALTLISAHLCVAADVKSTSDGTEHPIIQKAEGDEERDGCLGGFCSRTFAPFRGSRHGESMELKGTRATMAMFKVNTEGHLRTEPKDFMFGSIIEKFYKHKKHLVKERIILTHSGAAELYKEQPEDSLVLYPMGPPNGGQHNIGNMEVQPKQMEQGHHALTVVEPRDWNGIKPSEDLRSMVLPAKGGITRGSAIHVPFYEIVDNGDEKKRIKLFYEKYHLINKPNKERHREAWHIEIKGKEHEEIMALKLADGAAIYVQDKFNGHMKVVGVVDAKGFTHVGGKVYKIEVIQMSSGDNLGYVNHMVPKVYTKEAKESIGNWKGEEPAIQPWVGIVEANDEGNEIRLFATLISADSGYRTRIFWLTCRQGESPAGEVEVTSLVDSSVVMTVKYKANEEQDISIASVEFTAPLDFFQRQYTKARPISFPKKGSFRVTCDTELFVPFYSQSKDRRDNRRIKMEFLPFMMISNPDYKSDYTKWQMKTEKETDGMQIAAGAAITWRPYWNDYVVVGIVAAAEAKISDYGEMTIDVFQIYTESNRNRLIPPMRI